MRQTHTYAILRVTRASFAEIERLLKQAGYDEQFHEDELRPGHILIDMHGIALGEEDW